MRGRYPSGPEFVDQVAGSVIAKERARVLLETIAGGCRVKEACTRLGISEPRFDQLRIHGVERLVQSMEPRAAGRPPRTPSSAEERVRELEAKVAALQMQVKIAQARAEIALVLPNAVHDGGDNGTAKTPDQVAENIATSSAAEKKTTQKRRLRRQRRQPPRTRAPAT
jgi:hypothetical protein